MNDSEQTPTGPDIIAGPVSVTEDAGIDSDLGKGRRAWWFFAAILFLLIFIAVFMYIYDLNSEVTEDAQVNGNAVQVTSQIEGTVVEINADDTDHVQPGAVMVRLNPVDQEIAYERAQSTLATATRNVRTQYLQVSQLKAEVVQKQTELRKVKADLARRMQLASSGAVSREEVSHAKESFESAQAALDSTRQSLAQRKALVDGTVVRTHPDVLAAAANLRDAHIARVRTTILAPVEGTVTKRSVQVGQRITAGMALMSIVPLNDLWVTANFKESQLKDIRIGQPVLLTADIYGSSVVYHGEVIGLDAGTGSAFSLLPAENATGNWIKITQRVPVKIRLVPAEVEDHPLRVGLSMRVKVDTSDRSGAVVRSRSISNTIKTQVFEHELEDASLAVESVILANDGSNLKPVNP